jgi:hypothetical protein
MRRPSPPPHRRLAHPEAEDDPGSAADLGIGPTFDELLEVCQSYLGSRVTRGAGGGRSSDLRDVGIYLWRQQALDVLGNAIRSASPADVKPVPILVNPEWLDSSQLRRFQWTGIVGDGKRCHSNKVAMPHRPREAVCRLP